MGYFQPDTTGVNPLYYSSNNVYTLYATGQKIDFNTPVFLQGLKMVSTDGLQTPYTQGVDWTVNEDDIDYTSTSEILNGTPNFSLVLLKSITIIHQCPPKLQVAMSWQQLYQDPVTAAANSGGTSLALSPDLLFSMVQRIASLESEATTITQATGTTTASPRLLPYDINKTVDSNQIPTEIHQVNVLQGINIIRPVCGSFFRDSVTVTVPNKTLAPGVDYLIVGCNQAKTANTSNAGGIYEMIALLYQYAGPVNISYHAVGGDATVTDISAIYSAIQDVKNFLNANALVTTQSLPENATITNIATRQTVLENQMRALLSGTPSYSDATGNGQTVVKSVRANEPLGIHWFNLATLYKVQGSPDITTTDRISLHIQLVTARLIADVDVAVDLLNPTDPVKISAKNVVQDVGFKPYGVYTPVTIATLVAPQFRVVWATSAGTEVSGAILQIGINLPTLTETIAVEDNSGIQSAWVMDKTLGSPTPITPNDTGFLLPDGVTTWAAGVAPSTGVTKTMPNADGYLMWMGSQPVQNFDTTQMTPWTPTCLLPTSFRVTDIGTIELLFTDNANNYLTVPVRMQPTATAGTITGIAVIPSADGTTVPVQVTVATVTNGATTTITPTIKILSATSAQSTLALRYAVARI